MILNLNTLCRAKLNEKGKKIWLSQINHLPEDFIKEHPEIVESIRNKVDENNVIEIELWGLMSIFGPYMSSADNPLDKTTIEVKVTPNFNYSTREEY